MCELRILDEARHRLAVERRGHVDPPELLTLRDRLARPRTPTRWRIDGWQPAGSRVVLAAQFKARKTTLVGNLVRSLVDGDYWLDKHEVAPVSGTLAVLDFEMGVDQLDDWLRDQRIRDDDRGLVIPMRGRAALFDLLAQRKLAEWAKLLRDRDTGYLALDCLRPILDALGLDEHRDAGRFFVALDQLLTDAGIGDALVVHHMGHFGERSRGDSRIRDWPDVEWRLVRQDDEPGSARYISAYGRDVDVFESELLYDRTSRHLTIVGGSRRDAAVRAALRDVTAVLKKSAEPMTGRAIELALEGSEHKRAVIRSALALGIRSQIIRVQPGPRRSTLVASNGAPKNSSTAHSPARSSSAKRRHRDRRAVAARPARTVPHSWRCSGPPSEDHLVTDQDGRQQIVKRCPGCKFGAVNPSVDGGREVAGGVARGAIQIGGTGLDSSDGKGHEDAEHHSGGRRLRSTPAPRMGRSVLLRIP